MKAELAGKQPQQLVLNIIAQAPKAPRAVRAGAKGSASAAALARKPFKVTSTHVARSKAGPAVAMDHTTAFKPYQPAPGVLPRGKKIAMDDAFQPAINWAGNSLTNLAFNQGYAFLGYPYLAELAQVAEYRLISEVISTEATRKWITMKSSSEQDDKAEKIKELEKEFERLGVRAAFQTMSMQDGLFGRAHLFLDTGQTSDGKEMITPIGDGGEFTQKKFKGKKGWLRALKSVEPVWTYPMNYNASDPLADNWYRPEVWYVMSKAIHVSRLLTFVAKPVPDLMKPAYSFGGLSLTQMAKPYVDNWLETRQSVNDIIQAFSVMVLKTDMSVMLQEGNGDGLFNRADLFNNLRNNRGLMMVDKNSEEFANVSAPLSSLDKLQAQAQEHICSVSRIPLVKYTGLSPSGLNASSDGEIRAFYDTIHAYQEQFFGPHLTTVFKLAQLNIWGQVDEDLTFDYQPLWEMDEKDIVEMQRAKAETHGIYVDKGAVDAEEVREALADDENSPYLNLNPTDKPDLGVLPENVTEKEEDDEEGPDEELTGEEDGEAAAKKPDAS